MKATQNKRPRNRLTTKQKAFADAILADKKLSATQAALQAYGTSANPITYGSARSIAAENLAKPDIMSYLQTHAINAETTLVEIMNEAKTLLSESPGYASVARQAASDILDRVHGKPTQRIEASSTVLSIQIDLNHAQAQD